MKTKAKREEFGATHRRGAADGVPGGLRLPSLGE
jgi:hypothetical protein